MVRSLWRTDAMRVVVTDKVENACALMTFLISRMVLTNIFFEVLVG